jgi:transposase
VGKHRSYAPELKARVVIEALQGGKSLAQICRENNVAGDLLCHWRKLFLERAPQVFAEPKRSDEQERIAELERLIGQLTVELNAAKKVSSLLTSRSRNGGKS